jgi:hypothetical protein
MTTFTTSIALYAGFLILSSAVNAMQPPDNPKGFYGWLYRFLRLVTANVTEQMDSRYHLEFPIQEGSPSKIQASSITIQK